MTLKQESNLKRFIRIKSVTIFLGVYLSLSHLVQLYNVGDEFHFVLTISDIWQMQSP